MDSEQILFLDIYKAGCAARRLAEHRKKNGMTRMIKGSAVTNRSDGWKNGCGGPGITETLARQHDEFPHVYRLV
jgi:hypothetical protein